MDIKTEIKEEDNLSDDLDSQNETEFFHEVVTMSTNSDPMLLDKICDVAPFPKLIVKQIKCETVTCSNNWEIDRNTQIEQQILSSDFDSQNKGEFLPEDSLMKDKYNNVDETDNKIEIKEEPWWPETETSYVCDDIKDGDFPTVKSARLYTESICDDSGKSPLPSAEVSGRETCSYNENDLFLYEHQKSDVSEMSTAEKHALLEQSDKCSSDMNIRNVFLKQKSLIHKGKRAHKCNICAKIFSRLSGLRRHSLIHEGKKPHQCKTCNKRFTELPNLKKHNLIHEGKKPHRCKTCDKRFTQLSNLKKHNFVHGGKKPHQCKTCDKSFSQLSCLKTHNLIHEGKKPYQCITCNQSFTQLSNLRTHNLIHEAKKPHHCTTCNKSFTLLSSLKRHNLIHECTNPYHCTICGKSFTLLTSLKAHNLIHEGKKPHQCKTCGKTFTYLSNFKRHNLIHEGKKPHQCNTCDKRFTQSSHLKRHNLIHENKN